MKETAASQLPTTLPNDVILFFCLFVVFYRLLICSLITAVRTKFGIEAEALER